VAVRQDGLRDQIEFRLELVDGIATPAVESAVRRNLERRYPEVWANHQCGMYRLAFRYFPPGTFGRERKPKRLVDERAE
jgi:hypothetical protein